MGKIIHSFEAIGCVDVWLQAMDYLVEHKIGCNIVLGVEKPVSLSPIDYRIQRSVNEFLIRHEALPISTVATTIFPGAEFLHGGAHEVYEEFPKTFNTIREGWGTYAMRLLTKSLPMADGKTLQSPLQQLTAKMKRQRETRRMRSVYEAVLVETNDLLTDIPIYNAGSDSRHVRGGPCLSYLSFKLLPDDTVTLTSMYRYHYYVQRALGNLFGLAQLLAFVCQEVGAEAGPLVCHSTYAVLDTEGGWTNAQVEELMVRCKRMRSQAAA